MPFCLDDPDDRIPGSQWVVAVVLRRNTRIRMNSLSIRITDL
ncbi:hypothetical protein L810_5282 [Burkholderia sp. AU4i]|nr:hypothetical protein L810_5282 [Burkholderia sp. AU4i]QOH37432.1 hypothetical protein C7S14_2690 [Burkholderia cepacia]